MAQLDRAALRHLVHVDPQIAQEVEVLRLDDKLEAIVADLVDAEVEDLQVRQLGALGNVLRTFCIDVIAAYVDLANVPQVLRVEQILHSFVAEGVPGQLELLYVL